MDENYYKILVKRYVDKKLSDEELDVFTYLMKQGVLDQHLQDAMDEELNIIAMPVQGSRNSIFRLWSAAAIITISLGFCLYFLTTQKKSTVSSPIVSMDTIRILNSSNLIAKQVLPDKSTVWMQPNTQISYPSKFTGSKLREVKMQGEAFFEVTKDHSHPFVITSGNVLTRVWGTSFRIVAIKGQATKVSVLTGKVSVSLPSHTTSGKLPVASNVMLQPNEEATFVADQHELKKAKITSKADLLIWQKSNLNFENNTLASIMQILNNDYDVHIAALEPALNNEHITADFGGKNLPDILLLICKAVHANYTWNGNTITISKNN
jgi:transmembrane sensor